MKQIPVVNGSFALVDEEDFNVLNKYRWNRVQHKTGTEYVGRYEGRYKDGTFKVVLMHRQIMNAPQGQIIDHKNGDGLDNRRLNLRFCTHQQNLWNQSANKTGSSKFKGVYWDKRKARWIAGIRINKKYICRKHFQCEEDAARYYDQNAIRHFGEFARPNFPAEVLA